jgi:putative transposase
MPWEFKRVEDKRKELIEAYVNGGSMTELCKIYRVSRKTAYKWFNRFLELGEEKGLKDLSKAPHQPVRKFTDQQFDKAIELKLRKRTWGPKKILARLEEEYPKEPWPSPTRLYEVFKDQHLVTPRRFRRRMPATHPLGYVNNSNDVWMADFKGWFLTKDGKKCEPLTITDGHTRYLISCTHVAKKSADFIWPIFEEAFRKYGLPNRLRTDNGPPFGCLGIGRLTSLSIRLIKAGVVPEWINPGHPEENGRHERFHGTLKQAVASPPAESLKEQIARMKAFQEEYNYERPHEALGQETPGRHYYSSPREWDGVLRQPEYDTKQMNVRKVCQSGCIWLNQKEYYVGQVLVGEFVGMKEIEDDLEVYYGPIYLGKLRKGMGIERPKMRLKKVVRRA